MKTLLIVSKSTFMQSLIERVIRSHGFTVIAEAENGILGLQQYKEHNPYAVMMDVNMNEMCGISALKEIMKYDPAAKVVMVSAIEREEVVAEAMSSGARDYVIKPFSRERILSALSQL